MNEALKQAALTGAVTDLISGILALPAAAMLYFNRGAAKMQKNVWAMFFFLYSVSSLLGFAVHYYITDKRAVLAVWVILYLLLFETFDMFFISALYEAGKHVTKKTFINVHLVSLICYAVIIAFEFTGEYAIRVFAAVCGIEAIAGFFFIVKTAARHKKAEHIIMSSSLLFAFPVLYIQVKHDTLVKLFWYFDHNGIAHILLMISVALVFSGAYLSVKKQREGN